MNSNQTYPRVFHDSEDPCTLYVKDAATAFWISFNPMTKPKPGEEGWPVNNITSIKGEKEVAKVIADSLNPPRETDGLTEEEEADEPEYRDPMEEVKGWDTDYDAMIAKYGESYDRRKDYDRVFNTAKA